MVHRYIPIFRWKRGERVGVQFLSPDARDDVLPFFILGTEQYVGRDATKHKPVVTPPNVFAEELHTIWGNAPFYLDAIALPTGARHPLVDIAARARVKRLNLIPATQLNAPAPYQAAVTAVAGTDHRGVALRVDLNEFSSVVNWIGAWPFTPADTDLIVNLADSVGVVNALGAALSPTFTNLPHGNRWRTVTLTGTSMPANFTGYVAGTYNITRTEIGLWRRLSALALPYRLDYGDWATVPVVPPPSGIKWGYPINVKYTLPDEFLICRGVNTTGPTGVDLDVQLVGHARTISRYAGRRPVPTCWGDQRIDAIAAGAEPSSGLEHWVRISVNRHIEVTRHHLP